MKSFSELGFPGRLIAVEGLDGSGKSTQIYLLKRWLEMEGVKVFFSEWNSSALVKSATSKGKKRELLSPTTFSLIHATDFADRYERQLVPLLRAGYIVLCDRYIFTAFARDVVRGCPPKWVRGIYNFAALPENLVQRNFAKNHALDYWESGMDLGLTRDMFDSFIKYQALMAEQFQRLQASYKFRIVDGDRSVDEIHDELREETEEVMKSR